MADIIVSSDVDTFMQSANQSAMRTNVGYGTIVTQNSNNVSITGGSITGITDLAVADGGTGSSTASGARTNLEVYGDSEVDAKLATKETAGGVQIESAAATSADMGITTDFVDIGGVYTVSCYAKIDIANNQYNLALAGTVGDGLNNRAGIQVLSGGIIQFGERVGGVASTVCKRGNYTVGQWHHIVGIANNGTYTLYIDGDEKTSTGTYTLLGAREGFIWGNATITSDVNKRFNLKDCRIFNRALSAAEVADLYETGVVAVADRWGGTEIPDWSSTVDGWTGASYSISQEASFTDSASVTKNNVVTGTLSAVGEAIFTNNNPKFGAIGQVTKLSGWVYSDTADIKIAPRGSPTHSNVSGSVVPTSGEWTQFTAFSQTQVSGYRYSFSITNNLGGNLPAGAVVKFADVEATTLGAIADLPLDEGIGYQFHDRSSNHFDALASLTGVTHLVPKANGKVRVKAANASSAMYMLRADSILPENSIVSNVLSEQCYVDLTNSAQTLNDYRIRLNPSGSDLQIQRSDGSNHQTLGTVTAPSSLSDVDVQINYKQIAQ